VSLTVFPLQGPRHRYFQFVQWTFASKALHPILVDTVRRIIETSTLARAWEINRARKIEELEAKGKKSAARNLRKQLSPWEADTIGDRLSVQEWTGPAAFTDSVLSYAMSLTTAIVVAPDALILLRRYLLAVARVRQEDLYAVDGPTQFVDVVVLPMDGFK
jgi:alpha 1,6-mannosyltransferase